MKEILSFVASFCVVSAVIGGFYIIFPTGKMSKSVKYIAVLSLLCALLGTFCIGFKINITSTNVNDCDIFADNGAEMAKLVFEKTLTDNNVKYDKIILFTDKTADGSIIISRVTVYSDEPEEKITGIIGNNGEYEVEVVNEYENQGFD